MGLIYMYDSYKIINVGLSSKKKVKIQIHVV